MKRNFLVLGAAAVALLALLYYFYGGGEPGHAPAGQAALAALNAESFPAFQKAFNDSRDSVRVVVMLSPT
jgi:hypothetical protein